MAFPEYQLLRHMNFGWVREKDQQAKWFLGTRKQSSTALSLEDEIYELRRELEQLVHLEKSLTAPKVVEISMVLDTKINEYMNNSRRNR